MSLRKLLSDRKTDILKKWQEAVFKLYPAYSNEFLVSQTDQFANPVGHAIRERTEELLSELIAEGDIPQDRIEPVLDEILRIMAIQDFTPSGALSFIFILKTVIYEDLNNLSEPDKSLYCELMAFNSRIDDVILIAFDIYSKCKEKLFEIKLESAKNQMSGLLRRSDLISEAPEWSPAENE